MSSKKIVPLGVKLISGYYFLIAIPLLVLFLIAVLNIDLDNDFFSKTLAFLISQKMLGFIPAGNNTGDMSTFWFIGVMSIVPVYLGYSLWNRKLWAYNLIRLLLGAGLGFSVLGSPFLIADISGMGILEIINSITSIVIAGLAFFYLLSPNAKEFFGVKDDDNASGESSVKDFLKD